MILKTKNDNWVAAKFANLREFYVVLNTKNANLIEISGEYIIGTDWAELMHIFYRGADKNVRIVSQLHLLYGLTHE